MSLVKTIFRLLSIIAKEIVETIRRPGAALSLVVGPFLILAVFGLGYDSVRDPFRAVVVVPPDSALPTDVTTWQSVDGGDISVVGVVDSDAAGRQALDAHQADLVVIAPSGAARTFQSGQQSVIRVEYQMTDPVRASYAGVAAREISNQVNREIITRAVAQGQAYALQDSTTATAAMSIPPEIVASPTKAEAVNLSPTTPGIVPFYGPAAVALILQQMALTLVAMSVVKDRTSGVIELFRIAPVSTTEVILGKVVAFGGLVAIVGLGTIGVLVIGLGVPMLASPAQVIAIVAALIVASVGLGLLLGVISDSERQAVQLTFFVLLASVFFGGFVLPVTQFVPVVRGLADVLPVTHAVKLLQDLLLTGTTDAWWQLGALIAIGLVSLILSWVLLRRRMSKL